MFIEQEEYKWKVRKYGNRETHYLKYLDALFIAYFACSYWHVIQRETTPNDPFKFKDFHASGNFETLENAKKYCERRYDELSIKGCLF